MTDTNLEPQPPVGDVMVVYLGPVAPHWDIRSTFGDRVQAPFQAEQPQAAHARALLRRRGRWLRGWAHARTIRGALG